MPPLDHVRGAMSFRFDGCAAALFDFGGRRRFFGWPMAVQGREGALKSHVSAHCRRPFRATDTLGGRGVYKRDAAERVHVSAKPAQLAAEFAALLFNFCLEPSQRGVEGDRPL